MKIIHTSDLHLASALSSRLSQKKSRERQRELNEAFIRLCDEACRQNVRAIIISGDLFDTERVTERDIQVFLDCLKRHGNMTFLYLEGNHEGSIIRRHGRIPDNLIIFHDDWSSYQIDDVRFIGRGKCEADMFDTIPTRDDMKNIVLLHGELRDKSAFPDIIGKKELPGHGISYLALGHYHFYSALEFEKGHAAVYSGCPEGRGFDECGERGYVLIDTDNGIDYKFIPFSKRNILSIEVDISQAFSGYEVEEKIKESTRNIKNDDIVRVVLYGKRKPELKYDIGYLAKALEASFFHFEIKDKSTILLEREDYIHDKSLKGEFIRLCISEGLDASLTSRIVECGLSALAGEFTEG